MAQMGITCYRCEKRQEFQTYIELRSHLEAVHQGLCCFNGTTGDERQDEEVLLKEEFGRADLELRLERSARKVNTLMESLELKEQATGQLQEDLWIMTEKKAKLEQKYEEVCKNMEELRKKHANEDNEIKRKAVLKIQKLQRVIEEVKIEKGRTLEENEELRMKIEDMKKEEQGFASQEELEVTRKHAQECQSKLTEVEKVVVNQRIEIEELSEVGEDFKQIIQDLEEEIIYISKEGVRYKEENEELKTLVTRKEEEIKKLQDEKESHENVVSSLEESYRCSREKNSNMGEELSKVSFEIKKLQYELDSEQRKYSQYEADSKELLAELGELKTEIKIKDFQVAEYEERIDFMKTGLEMLKNKIKNDNNDNNDNFIFQKKMKDIVEFCYCSLQERQRHGARLVLATNDKTMKWADKGSWIEKKDELHAANTETEWLRKRVQQLEEELDKATENKPKQSFIWRNKEHEAMTSLKKEVENQVKNSKRLQKENKKLEKSIRELEGKLMQSYDVNEKLQYDLEENNVEFEEIQRKYEEISSENYQLVKTTSELRDTNESLAEEVKMLENMKDNEKDEKFSRKKMLKKKSSVEEKIAREHYKREDSGKLGKHGDQEELGTLDEDVKEEYRFNEKKQPDDVDYLTENEEKCARNAINLTEQADAGGNDAKGALEDFETSVNVDEKHNTSESLESLEFKYLEAKIEFENQKEKMFGRRKDVEVEAQAKQQSSCTPQTYIKQHSTDTMDRLQADLKQQSTSATQADIKQHSTNTMDKIRADLKQQSKIATQADVKLQTTDKLQADIKQQSTSATQADAKQQSTSATQADIKQQSTSATRADVRLHSTDKLRADLKQQSTNQPKLDAINSDMMKETPTTTRKSSAVTPCLSATLSCSKNLQSPLPSGDLSVAFLRKRSSRFENLDPEIEDEVKQKSKKIFSKKELEMIAEDAFSNTESGVHFCNDEDIVDDSNATASGVSQYPQEKHPSTTEIERINSYASETGDGFVDYTLERDSSTAIGEKVGGTVYHVAKQDLCLELSQSAYSTSSLTWGYVQALEDVSTRDGDIINKKGEGSKDKIRHESDVLQTDSFNENQSEVLARASMLLQKGEDSTDKIRRKSDVQQTDFSKESQQEALARDGMLVQKGEGSTDRTRRSSGAVQLEFSRQDGISNEGTNAARRKIYNRQVLDSQMHGELKLRSESKNEKLEAEEACCEENIDSVDSVGEVHIWEDDPTIVNKEYMSDNGNTRPRNQVVPLNLDTAVDSDSLEESDSQHSTKSLPQQGQEQTESFQQLKSYQGRRHSLAYELLKRKKLDYDFKQEYKAKETSERANNRRISSGEVDAEKLREKAKQAKETASKLTDEDEGFDYAGQAVARIGWFQMTALAERLRKRNDAPRKQGTHSDAEEATDNEEDEEHAEKTVRTDDSDLSVYSDSDDSDSNDSGDSESLPDDLDVNAYIRELLNTDRSSEQDQKVSLTDERASNKDVSEECMSNTSKQNDDTEAVIKQQNMTYETTEERRGRLTKTKSTQSDEEEQGLPQISGEINSV